MATGDLVRFGLKNVHYAVSNGSGFETPVHLNGAVQLTTTPEGDSYDFYAEDRIFYHTETNSGISGSIELASIDDDFLTAVLGNHTDETSKLVYESTDDQPTECALMFEIDGNLEKQRYALYGVTFSRVDTEANTRSDSTEPDTVTLDFTAIGTTFTIDGNQVNVVKAHCSNDGDSAEAYNNFFTKVPQPGTSPE